MYARALIITEGGSKIGFGHITRCISLYQALAEKGVASEFTINADVSVKYLLKGINYRLFKWLDKEKKLFSLIQNVDIAIIDSYLSNYDFYKRISNSVKVPVYIDDDKRIDYPRGIVVNGSNYAEKLNYYKKNDVTYLLGAKYALLRKEFWQVPNKKLRKKIESIMITLGGDDARNTTPKILELLTNNYPKLNKRVVVAKAFNNANIKEIEKLKDNRTELIYNPNAEKMKRIMLESDIAISAGGQTIYELARVGLPTIAIAVAENQLNNIRRWQRLGFIEYAGRWEDKETLNNVKKRLKLLENNNLKEKMAKAGRVLIDGKGPTLVVEELIKRL